MAEIIEDHELAARYVAVKPLRTIYGIEPVDGVPK